MRIVVIVLSLAGAIGLGACRHEGMPTRGGSMSINATGLFGGAEVSVAPISCAGRVTLSNGSGSVKDSCFSGDTNVVLCTDVSSASAVRCAPGAGSLSINGSGSDVIAYARMR